MQQNVSQRRDTQTVWKNPTPDKIVFDIFLGPGKPGQTHDFYHVAPGGEVTVPSMYDQAIRETTAEGIVIGGKAPRLLKIGEKPGDVSLDKSLTGEAVVDPAVKAKLDAALAENEKLKFANAEGREAFEKLHAQHTETSSLLGDLAQRLAALEAQKTALEASVAPKSGAAVLPSSSGK
jgi:hypothetical protein